MSDGEAPAARCFGRERPSEGSDDRRDFISSNEFKGS